MKRCTFCKADELAPAEKVYELEVAGRTFTGTLPVTECSACGEAYVDDSALRTFDLAVAASLAQEGPPTGEAFRFMRKTLGMKAKDVAELLGLQPETVSRWEKGKKPAERRAVALLGTILLDHLEGRTTTRDRLERLRNAQPPAQTSL